MARTPQSFPGYVDGFSLVEVMVALTLSLLLLSAIFQVFTSSKASYRMNEGLARIQETGRFVVDLLSSALRMAGYQGCLTRNKIAPNVIVKNPPSVLPYQPEDVLRGENNLASGDSLVAKQDALVGSDSLSIIHASATGAHLTGNMETRNGNIQINGNPAGFEAGDILMITDCASIDIFRATNVSSSSNSTKVTIAHTQSKNTSSRLSKAYQSDALVMAFESTTYYVADTGRDNMAGDPIYGLYVQHLRDNPVELVAGVENMQVLYGVDTDADGSADTYANADAVANFANVISARVALLVSSVAPATTRPNTQTYTLLDETVDPADGRYLRKVFTFTATARNRSLRSPMFD